jgi:hypothetical protein
MLDKPIQVRITPDQQTQFFGLLPSSTNYSIAIPDLQTFLDDQLTHSNTEKSNHSKFGSFFTEYHSYDDITAFLDEMAGKHQKLVKKFQIGTTSEGRPIYAWRLHKRIKNKRQNSMSSWLEDLEDNMTQWFESARDLFRIHKSADDSDHEELEGDDEQQLMKKQRKGKGKDKKKLRKPMEIVINGGQHGREWISPVGYMPRADLFQYLLF